MCMTMFPDALSVMEGTCPQFCHPSLRKKRSDTVGTPTRYYASRRGDGLDVSMATWMDLKNEVCCYFLKNLVMKFLKVIF